MISLKFVPKGLNNNIPALVQMMTWCRPDNKALSEPMVISLVRHSASMSWGDSHGINQIWHTIRVSFIFRSMTKIVCFMISTMEGCPTYCTTTYKICVLIAWNRQDLSNVLTCIPEFAFDGGFLSIPYRGWAISESFPYFLMIELQKFFGSLNQKFSFLGVPSSRLFRTHPSF